MIDGYVQLKNLCTHTQSPGPSEKLVSRCAVCLKDDGGVWSCTVKKEKRRKKIYYLTRLFNGIIFFVILKRNEGEDKNVKKGKKKSNREFKYCQKNT